MAAVSTCTPVSLESYARSAIRSPSEEWSLCSLKTIELSALLMSLSRCEE